MGAPKQPAFACMYVILKKTEKKPFVKNIYKILFCAAKPTTTTRTTKETKQNKKGKLVYTLVYIEMNRIYINIYIYIIYRMWARLAPSENCNKQTENRVQHTLRFLILQILLLLWLYMYIIIL